MGLVPPGWGGETTLGENGWIKVNYYTACSDLDEVLIDKTMDSKI